MNVDRTKRCLFGPDQYVKPFSLDMISQISSAQQSIDKTHFFTDSKTKHKRNLDRATVLKENKVVLDDPELQQEHVPVYRKRAELGCKRAQQDVFTDC